LRIQPDQDHYATELAGALLGQARGTDDAEIRRISLEQALAVAQRVKRSRPLDPDHDINLARILRTWAALAGTSDEGDRLGAAERHYRSAIGSRPYDVTARNELATLLVEQGKSTQALALLAESLRLDDRDARLYETRARIRRNEHSWAAALQDYERALALDSESVGAWTGKAIVLAQMNRLEEAVAADRRSLAFDPYDLGTRRHLAELHRRAGRLGQALQEAETGRSLAPRRDRPEWDRFIAEVDAERAMAGGTQ
jgi:tetratricopeptide (TPR) repeat protein